MADELSLEDLIAQADKKATGQSPSSKKDKYNPSQSVGGYLFDNAKLVPAGLAGLPMDTVYNVRDLAKITAAVPMMARGGIPGPALQIDPNTPAKGSSVEKVATTLNQTRAGGASTFLPMLGYEGKKPPGPKTELSGDIINAVASMLAFKKVPLKGQPAGMTMPQVVGGGVGAGIGQNIGERVTPDSVIGPAIGTFLGGGAGVFAPSYASKAPSIQLLRAMLGQKGRDEFAANSKELLSPVVRKSVENQLAKELRDNPQAIPNIESSRSMATAAPGVTMDIGQASQVPSIVQQTKASATSTPASLDTKVALDAANRQRIVEQLANSRDAPDVGVTSAVKVRENKQAVNSVDEATEALLRQRFQQAESVPRANAEQLGRSAKEVRVAEKSSADIKVRTMLDDAEQAAAGKTFDVNDVVSTVESAADQPIFKYAPERKPKIVSRIEALRKDADSPDAPLSPVQFKELRSMREAVNEDIRNASGPTTQDRSMRRELGIIKDKIDEAIVASGGEVANKYGAFVAHYRDEYAPRFLRGLNIKQTLKDSTGVDRIADEALFSRYFKANNPSSAKQYLALYGKSAEGKRLMHEAILDRYANEVIGAKGEVIPARHDAFMQKYGSTLEALKKGGIDVSDALASEGIAARTSFDRMLRLKQERTALANDEFTAAVTDSLGVKTTDQIMQKAVSDPRATDIVIKTLNETGAEGMLNWFAQDISTAASASSQGKLSSTLAGKLSDKNYMYAYRSALIKARGVEGADAQIAKLKTLTELSRRLEATEVAPFSGARNTTEAGSMSSKVGVSVRSIWSMVRAITTGRTSESDAALVIGGQIGTRQLEIARSQVLHEIMTNPDALDNVIAIAKSGSPQDTGAQAATIALAKKVPSFIKMLGGIGVRGSKQTAVVAPTILAEDQAKEE